MHAGETVQPLLRSRCCQAGQHGPEVQGGHAVQHLGPGQAVADHQEDSDHQPRSPRQVPHL